jgi:site-specific recombinase XerD
LYYVAQEKKLSPNSINQAVCGLRFFYKAVMQRSVDFLCQALPFSRRVIRRPQVFSGKEIEQLLTVGCPRLKARAFLMTVYGGGLRLDEACHLKGEHINRARMQIRVEQGKGRKDRYTLLSPVLLKMLERYWQADRPQHWLFPATTDPTLPMDPRTGQKMFYRAVARAKLPHRGGIHCLRHSFATHLLEAGVEITVVQRLLGHSHVATTANYLHVRQERMAEIKSPLQLLDLERAVRQEI